jgi:hypothetical protein
MPVRINLLADAQAAEEARRRDPVKRGVWIGGFVICLVLIYIGKLYADMAFEKISTSRLEGVWKRSEPKFNEVITNQAKIVRLEAQLQALDRFSTNRFLWGTLLNALQQATVEEVELTSFISSQEYIASNSTPIKASETTKVARLPDLAIEKISLKLEARDWSPSQQSYGKYREALSTNEFFAQRLAGRSFKLGTLGRATFDVLNPSRSYLPFPLECVFPEVTRK